MLYVAAATGGIWKSTNHGMSWKPIFDSQPDNTFGALAIFPGRHEDRLGRHRRTEQPAELVVGRRRLSLDRRRRRRGRYLGLHETRVDRPRRARSRRTRTSPTSRPSAISGRATPSAASSRRPTPGRTWTKVLYVDTLTGATDLVDGSARPERALRRDVSAPAQGVRLQRRRTGQRDLQDDRRRRHLEEARERHSRRRQRTHRSRDRAVEARRPHRDDRARDGRRHLSHRGRRRDVEADERHQSAADVLQQADHRSQQRQAHLAARHLHRQERGRRRDVRGGADLARPTTSA